MSRITYVPLRYLPLFQIMENTDETTRTNRAAGERKGQPEQIGMMLILAILFILFLAVGIPAITDWFIKR